MGMGRIFSSASGQRVAILLCTFNGAEFLEEQLESIVKQTHPDWILYASDDGSSDRTLEILNSFRARLGADRVKIFEGPRQGFAKNFLSLIKNPVVQGDFYAFCDQDDIWYENKLARGLRYASSGKAGQPFLFCSRTRLIDASGRVIGFSPLFTKEPTFHNALVQSLAGANTMLLNGAARALLVSAPGDVHIVSHDWLAYILVSGCGGRVVYDREPSLDYRQHGANLIGSNISLGDRWRRIKKMYSGTFREWNDDNLRAIRGARKFFTYENRVVLCRFVLARKSRLLARIWLFKGAGLYRQTVLGNIGLVVAGSIRRL